MSYFPDITLFEWGVVIFCALLIGISRAGISGAGIVIIPMLAAVFGGKLSAGFLVPMLCMADVLAVRYYNRHTEWKYLVRLIPWTLVGIALAAGIGGMISDKTFKHIIAIIIFICLGLMFWQDSRKKKIEVPETWWFSGVVGLAGGFATMIGNASGPIMALYLLSMHLPKNKYIGTAAWFYMIVNLIKLPFHFFVWHTISLPTLATNLAMFPAIVAGIILGIYVIKKFPEKSYRALVIATTAVSALLLLF